eukprot:TRINITY_DN3043_c0_g1_i2.p1 TRINITY_DN3043_c0_g1~~TRINITY_DN3043_c0_g1_i2.p1  ORF type:complete len:539 (+),score=100.86 TRINITY_DN3043_c0_g1_i2:396-2012(+)
MEDKVTHLVRDNRVEFTHFYSDPKDLPYYYFQVRVFALHLVPLTPEEKNKLVVVKREGVAPVRSIAGKNPTPGRGKLQLTQKEEQESELPQNEKLDSVLPRKEDHDLELNRGLPHNDERDPELPKNKNCDQELTPELPKKEERREKSIRGEPELDETEEVRDPENPNNVYTGNYSRKLIPKRNAQESKESKKSRRAKRRESRAVQDSVVYDADGAPFDYKVVIQVMLWPELNTDINKLYKIGVFYRQIIDRWGLQERAPGGYTKRVPHDSLVSRDQFTSVYRQLKEKYKYWVREWEECTDPSKFVYEDVGIAAFLLCLWEDERRQLGVERKQTFVDIGAGNGFLVYLLTMEGHQGSGIDLVKRRIWDKYPREVKLFEEPIMPDTSVYNVDWIIANHSDELTPWVPLIASRSPWQVHEVGNHERGSPEKIVVGQRYFVLPCCEWDFHQKFQKHGNLPKFQAYLQYIQKIGEDCGFEVKTEHLRIPSTRNVAQVGTIKITNPLEEEEMRMRTELIHKNLLRVANFTSFQPKVRKSSSHRG